MKRHRVTLTDAEREELAGLLSRGKADVRKLKHARVLLRADAPEGGPAWPDVRIAEAVGVRVATVERLRRRSLPTQPRPPGDLPRLQRRGVAL